MTPDEQHQIYEKGFEAGQKHTIPSEDTKDFMKETRDKFEKVTDTINDIKNIVIRMEQKFSDQLESIVEQTKKTNGRVNKLDEYKPMLDDIAEEREDTKEYKKGLINELKTITIMGFLKALMMLSVSGAGLMLIKFLMSFKI